MAAPALTGDSATGAAGIALVLVAIAVAWALSRFWLYPALGIPSYAPLILRPILGFLIAWWLLKRSGHAWSEFGLARPACHPRRSPPYCSMAQYGFCSITWARMSPASLEPCLRLQYLPMFPVTSPPSPGGLFSRGASALSWRNSCFEVFFSIRLRGSLGMGALDSPSASWRRQRCSQCCTCIKARSGSSRPVCSLCSSAWHTWPRVAIYGPLIRAWRMELDRNCECLLVSACRG